MEENIQEKTAKILKNQGMKLEKKTDLNLKNQAMKK